jgi:hypothetical protein
MHDYWGDKGQNPTTEVWQVIEKKEIEVVPPQGLSAPLTEEEVQETEAKENLTVPNTKEEIEETTVTETENPEFFKDVVKTQEPKATPDPIDNALKSIEKEQSEVGGFTPISEVIKKKRDYIADNEIDVFDEDND